MQTHSSEWSDISREKNTAAITTASHLNRVLCLATRAFMALVPALAIVIGSAWLISAPDLMVYLQATLWTSGFVFFGLAIESKKPVILASLATGIALPALAVLSSKVAAEFAVVAAVLVAAWIAVAIFRRW